MPLGYVDKASSSFIQRQGSCCCCCWGPREKYLFCAHCGQFTKPSSIVLLLLWNPFEFILSKRPPPALSSEELKRIWYPKPGQNFTIFHKIFTSGDTSLHSPRVLQKRTLSECLFPPPHLLLLGLAHPPPAFTYFYIYICMCVVL